MCMRIGRGLSLGVELLDQPRVGLEAFERGREGLARVDRVDPRRQLRLRCVNGERRGVWIRVHWERRRVAQGWRRVAQDRA